MQKFMRGSTPRPETRDKLLRWYNALPPDGRVVLPTPEPPEEGEELDVELVRQLVAQRATSALGCTCWRMNLA